MKLARAAMFAGAVFVMVWLYRSLPAAMTTTSAPRNVFAFAVGMFVSWCALGMFLCGAVLPLASRKRRVQAPVQATGPAATSALCNGCGHRPSVHYCLTHGYFLCELCAGIGHLDCKFTDYAHGVALRRAKVKADDYQASIDQARSKAAGN